MKKSLSLLLAIALVFSMFAGVASAADNGKTALEKFNELKEKGIFSGLDAQGTPGLDKPMTRAQYARVAALILGLQGINPGGNDTKVVTEKPFQDVELDAWFVEEVAAVKEFGIMVGNPDGTFNPNGNITVQELAVVTAQSLGLTPVEDAKVEGADDWAAGYIQALLNEGINFPTNYKEPATREQLVVVAYDMNEIVNPEEPDKVSVVSAKPIGVQKVEVKLDKAVDTAAAKLTLKRNSTTIATKTEWSTDGKSAVLTLENTKIIEGEYSVELSGLAANAVANAVAKFTAENEKVTSLEFVSASDTIAQTDHARVEFRALNQYDEPVSLPAGSFSAYASTPDGANVTKDAFGKLYVTLDTNHPNLPVGTQISINIINTESQVSATKVFKLGTPPYVAKIELGQVVYSNGENYLSKAGDKAVVELIQYDQYGHQITQKTGSLFDPTAFITPYLNAFADPQIIDDNNDDIKDVVVKLNADAKATGEYTLNVFGGNTATAIINVKSTNYAATVELDTSVVLAEDDVGKYIPITAYDKDGNKLSAQDIVDNIETGHIQITASNNLVFGASLDVPAAFLTGPKSEVVKVGEHKGKLHIAEVNGKGYANIYVNINPTSANGILFSKNFQFNIQEKRYPVTLKVETESAKKAIAGLGSNDTTSKLKLNAYDQYGEKIKGTIGNITTRDGKTVTYDVYVQLIKNATSAVMITGVTQGTFTNLSDVFDKDLVFTIPSTAQPNDYLEVKFSLQKYENGTLKDTSVASVSRKIEVIDPSKTKLTFSLKSLGALFDAIDDKTMDGDADEVVDDNSNSVISKHAKEVELEAKTASGETVAIPKGYVNAVVSSDSNIIVTNSVDKVLGNKAGKATITVFYTTPTNESGTLTAEVEVKSDAISVVKFSKGKKNSTASSGDAAFNVMGIEVEDNYGTKYSGNDIKAYDKVLGIRYTISDVKGNGSVTVNNNGLDTNFGTLTITGTVQSFTLTATAPSGQVYVTAVEVQ